MCVHEPDKPKQTNRRKAVMKTTVSDLYFAFFCGMGRKMKRLPEKHVKIS